MVQATQGLDRFGPQMSRKTLCPMWFVLPWRNNDLNGGVPARPYIGQGSRVTQKVLGRFIS